MKLKYILSDLDGVIRKFPTERDAAIEQKYGIPAGTLLRTAFEKTNLQKAVCGSITDEAWRLTIEEALGKVIAPDSAKLAVQEWSDFPGKLDHEYLEHLSTHYAGIPVAILTNGTTKLHQNLVKLGVLNQFTHIFNSAEIGLCKPDRKVFDYVLNELGYKASEVLFVDDSISHIEAAAEMGFQVHHYKSLDGFRAFNLE